MWLILLLGWLLLLVLLLLIGLSVGVKGLGLRLRSCDGFGVLVSDLGVLKRIYDASYG